MKFSLSFLLLAGVALGRIQVPTFGPEVNVVRSSELSSLSSSLVVDTDGLKYFTEASAADPEKIAIEFFKENFKFQPGFSFVIANSYKTDHNGVTHVYLKQQYRGITVENGDADLHVDRYGRVFSFSSSFFMGNAPSSRVEEDQNEDGQLVFGGKASPILTPVEAVVRFADFIKVPQALNADMLSESFVFDGDDQVFPGNFQDEPVLLVSGVPFSAKNQIPVTRKYLIVNDETAPHLVPVWDMLVDMQDGDNWFHAQMDMKTGKVHQLIDWVQEASYVVYPVGVNDPSDGPRSLVENPEDPLASPLGWHDQGSAGRGRTGDGKFKSTVGNNVWAQSNPDGRSSYEGNYRPTGKGPQENLTFDFPLDLTKEPSTYIDSAVTNLFYWNNIIHDIFYQYGFDEKSGNFQEDNFERGGKGNDAVVANAQDGSGYNNANFATPPDGQKPRMRMYVWTTSRPARDGDLEAGIVIHEYGHGISTRLTGGPANSGTSEDDIFLAHRFQGCLGFGEAGGMGEGWGDFWATALRMRKNYTSDMDFAMGQYSAGRGIRGYPYSTSMKTNPHTYSYLKKPGYSGVHAIGSVWASMLYDVYWAFVNKYGFNENWYSVTEDRKNGRELAGNILIMQLVVDGLKLQPCRPNFIDARDAILKADEMNFNGEHICLLWKSFAKRGLGVDARKGGVDGFELPKECS